jgi:hypothetical protein
MNFHYRKVAILKISNALTTEPVKYAIRIFYILMIFFYLLWAMFHDESSIPSPTKFEVAMMMIVVAMLCNIGFFFSLGSSRAKFKKTIVSLLLMAAFFNFFMFVSISHNPFQLLEETQWFALRKILAYGSVLFSLVISVFVLRYENDS